jgi:uncharacterized phage protein (TIGR01671 family)
MREILFRAKTVKNAHWIYGDLFKTGTDPSDEEWAIGYWDDEDGWMNEQVQPETIGQFTGLLDSNNVRIFEGDIVNVTFHEYDRVGRFCACTDLKPYYRGVVTWNDRLGKYEILIETNSQFDGTSHIVSCEIGWGHEEFLVVGQYIDDPFPLERDRQQR